MWWIAAGIVVFVLLACAVMTHFLLEMLGYFDKDYDELD